MTSEARGSPLFSLVHNKIGLQMKIIGKCVISKLIADSSVNLCDYHKALLHAWPDDQWS